MNKITLASLLAASLLSLTATAENVITMNGKTIRTPNGAHVVRSESNGRTQTIIDGVVVEDKSTTTRNGRTETVDNLAERKAGKALPPVVQNDEDDEDDSHLPPPPPRRAPRPAIDRDAEFREQVAADKAEIAARRAQWDREFERRFGRRLPTGRDEDYGTRVISERNHYRSCVNGVCQEVSCDGAIFEMDGKVRCVPRAGASSTSGTSAPQVARSPRQSLGVLPAVGSGASQ